MSAAICNDRNIYTYEHEAIRIPISENKGAPKMRLLLLSSFQFNNTTIFYYTHTYTITVLNGDLLPFIIVTSTANCTIYAPPSDTMAQPPLTDHFFSTENENNITVAQEDARSHAVTDQLVSSTPHMPLQRRDDGEMVCVLLAPSPINTAPNTQHLLPHTLTREHRRVLLEDMLPLPSQDTTHQGGGLDLLVCPPLPRAHQMRTMCSRLPPTPSGVMCGGVGWLRRMGKTMPHQTDDTTKHNSEVGNNFGVMDVTEHTSHNYTFQPVKPRETTLNTPVTLNANSHFSFEHLIEEETECKSKSGVPREAEGIPPPTQQFVSGNLGFIYTSVYELSSLCFH